MIQDIRLFSVAYNITGKIIEEGILGEQATGSVSPANHGRE